MFDYDARLKEVVRAIAGSVFRGTNRCFYIEDSEENLRLSYLDQSPEILLVREGKGKVDRIVPVSGKVWEKIDEYISCYKPGEYLFEGQIGAGILRRVFTGFLRMDC